VSTLIQGMTTILEWLFNFSSTIGLPYWGVAIILFTIIIKILLYPLTVKQMVSMRKMTELQPKVREIQKKYGHDKQKMNMKVMELYSQEKASPYAGCLPLLVQLPILLIFYRALFNLTARASNDPSFQFLGFNITETYGLTLDYHLLLPIIAGVTTYFMTKVSMANSPKPMVANDKKNNVAVSAEQTQKIMLYVMPLFMAYIVLSLPSGLGIYIVTMNIVSILQTIYIYKVFFKREEKKAKLKAEQ
jgi:YidC/Oxa1 family membrane protein insertase